MAAKLETKANSSLSMNAIRKCSTKKMLESKFKEHKVSIEQRIELLTKAMGNPAISYTCGFPSAKKRYEVIIASFVDGIWKHSSAPLELMEK